MANETIVVHKNSKSILQLEPGKADNRDITAMAFPVQEGIKNYHLFVRDILELITKEYLGLDKVENTADLDKPISRLVLQALQGKANTSHQHAFADIPGLADEFGKFFAKNEQIPMSNLQAVTEALTEYALKQHQHAIGDVEGLENALSGKAASDHTHNLETLNGWEDFISSLNQAFENRPTTAQTEQMVDSKINNLKGEIEQMLDESVVREIPGTW